MPAAFIVAQVLLTQVDNTVPVEQVIKAEQGALIALLGKGKADASITVTLEWSRDDATGGA